MLTVHSLKTGEYPVMMLDLLTKADGRVGSGGSTSPFPQEFLDCLPSECSICGAPTEVTDTLSLLRCSNPQCGGKATKRLVTMLKDLGIINMGPSKCDSFLANFGVSTPYAIFMYEPDVDGPLYDSCSMDFSSGIFDQVNEKRSMLLWEYVKIGNLPGIRDSARKMLSHYDDLHVFFEDLEAGGIGFVQELLSIKGKPSNGDIADEDGYYMGLSDSSDSVSVKAVATYQTLMEYKEELLQAVGSVHIVPLDTEVVNLCISRAVGAPYSSKNEFVAEINSKFDGVVRFNLLDSVSKDCQYLIWAGSGNPTPKVNKVNKMNDKRRLENVNQGLDEEYGLIPILAGKEFFDLMEEEYL
jgi:hypothetical protein